MDALGNISTYTAGGDGEDVEFEDVADILVRHENLTRLFLGSSFIIYRYYVHLRVIVNRLVQYPNFNVYSNSFLSIYVTDRVLECKPTVV